MRPGTIDTTRGSTWSCNNPVHILSPRYDELAGKLVRAPDTLEFSFGCLKMAPGVPDYPIGSGDFPIWPPGELRPDLVQVDILLGKWDADPTGFFTRLVTSR